MVPVFLEHDLATTDGVGVKIRDFLALYPDVNLYHFTDRSNLDSIDRHGLLSWVQVEARGVECATPGGNQWSRDADKRKQVEDYVHLCFCRYDHPMEIRARLEGRMPRPIYLTVDARALFEPGVLGAPGVANKAGVPVLPIEDALDQINHEILCGPEPTLESREESRAFIAAWKIAVKAEVLVPKSVSRDMINWEL